MVALRNGFRELQSELAAAEKALADAEKRMPHRQPPTNVEAEVEKAITLMDRIEAACANPAAREELNRLVQDLGIRIGLTFREGRRNNRPVRVLQGGGPHHGDQEHPGEAERSAAGSKKVPSIRKSRSTGSRRTSRGGVRPSPADRQTPRQPSETGRLYKASRGDRT